MEGRSSPFVEADLEPPPPSSRIYSIALVGFTFVVLALVLALLNLILAGSWAEVTIPLRAVLCFLGGLLTGAALSMNSRLPPVWGLAALTFLATRWGFPAEWDSFQLVGSVLAAGSALFGIMLLLPWQAGVSFLLGAVLFHFGGVLSAISLPPPQPWLGNQMWTRVFRPYLQFIYMNNAYQFYSPDPGPASQLWFCIVYEPSEPTEAEKEEPPTIHRWVKIPDRKADFRDPLGQTYYRRLALTEQTVQFNPPSFSLPPREAEEVNRRRQLRNDIPMHAELAGNIQYRPATEMVQRYLLTSYARYIAVTYPTPDPKYFDNVERYQVKLVKMYRVTHQIVPISAFVGAPDANKPELRHNPVRYDDPTTMMPYFVGDYDREGTLIDSADPLLNWLLPILNQPSYNSLEPRGEIKPEEYDRWFNDSVIKHAGSDHRYPDGKTGRSPRK